MINKEDISTFLNLHKKDLLELIEHQLQFFVNVDALSFHLISFEVLNQQILYCKLLIFYNEAKPQSCFTPAQDEPKVKEKTVKISISSGGILEKIIGF